MTGRTADGRLETVRIVPEGSPVANYAFDVTPARLVTGLITERGVLKPERASLAAAFPDRLSRISLRSIQATKPLFSSEIANVLDNSGKIHPTLPGLVEGLIDLLGMLAERRRRTRGLGRVLR
ncbi:hypothetical protein E4T56_gene15846, partial [Termitomyces sp. T112]